MAIAITPLSDALAAEIGGGDLTEPLNEETPLNEPEIEEDKGAEVGQTDGEGIGQQDGPGEVVVIEEAPLDLVPAVFERQLA